MTDDRDTLREQLAALAHEQWSGWMEYMKAVGHVDTQGRWVLPTASATRWQRQMQRPYAELSEAEKDSDRAEADRVLALLPRSERDALIAALVQEYADVLARRGQWRLMAGQEVQVNRILEDGAQSAHRCMWRSASASPTCTRGRRRWWRVGRPGRGHDGR